MSKVCAQIYVLKFQHCSTTLCARGCPHRCTGRSKGWGIVEFETPEEVRWLLVLRCLAGSPCADRLHCLTCGVGFAVMMGM